MNKMLHNKRKLGVLVIGLFLLIILAIQWRFFSSGWVIAEQQAAPDYVFRVRALPYDSFTYLALSVFQLSFRPRLLECSYQCEITHRGRLMSSNMFAWDSLFAPQVQIKSTAGTAGQGLVEFAFTREKSVRCSFTRNGAVWEELRSQ